MNRLNFLIVFLIVSTLSSCGIYSFKDVSIDPAIKTIKIGFIENRARIVNPQLSPLLTDKIQQKINQQTKLTRTNNEDAHLIISGYISDYSVSTAGISSQQAASNRLTVSVHLTLRNNIENKTVEFDVSRGFDFSANLSIEQAQSGLQDEILRNMTDEIFNKIFSNW